mgnify:CR=1 FL=1
MSLFSKRKFFDDFKNEPKEMKEIIDLTDQLLVDALDSLPVSLSDIIQGMSDGTYSDDNMDSMVGLMKIMASYRKLMNKSLEASFNQMKKRDDEIKELNDKLDKITKLLIEKK